MKKFLFVSLILLLNLFFCCTQTIASTKDNKASSIYNNNVQSVVYIETQEASGSGVIIKEDGTLITCFHVIANADEIKVKLKDGSMYSVNGFRYINPLSDVAILTLDTTRKFKPIAINSLNNFKIGEKIYTISNPQGLEFVFSDGMINQITKDYIQFSAPISSGSSGGALLNKKGNLLGIITSQLIPSEAQNINFALPNDYFVSKINNTKIINENSLNWTEFLVEHADEEQFKVYMDYAFNKENYSMLYKYLKPFTVRNDVPKSLYPILGSLALSASFIDDNPDNLDDAYKFFNLAYKHKQNEEAALFALPVLASITGHEDKTENYMTELAKKYPNSFEKLMEIMFKIGDAKENDVEALLNALADYIEHLVELIGE